MRTPLLLLSLTVCIVIGATVVRAFADENDRPLTEAERSFLEGAKDHVIEVNRLESDSDGISLGYSNGLFAGVKARFIAKDHCKKHDKLVDEDNIHSSQVENGRIVEFFACLSPDEPEPIRQLRKAAKRGDAESQFALGRKYRQGQGVDRNLRQATGWFHMAAEQGHASAQNMLGVIYSNDKAYAQAADMFRLAARQHNAAAQISLGVAYELGLGVPVDYPRAYMWYRFSRYDGVEKLRERIRRKMTRQQLDLSEDLMLECLTSYMSNCK